MYDKEFAELVKVAVEKLKEDTVYEMIKRSEGYQEESVARAFAEQCYGELDLTKEQRKVCDAFLDCRDGQNLEYAECCPYRTSGSKEAERSIGTAA